MINVVRVLLERRRLKRQNRRKLWSRSWLQRRDTGGSNVLDMLNSELLVEDTFSYENYLRMSNDSFNTLLMKIEHDIRRQDTFMRQAISPRSQLEITLRFLATGGSYREIMYNTRVHESTISKFVIKVCEAIYTNLRDEYLKTPNTEAEWREIAHDFDQLWHFPHCLGAMDGRHIKFRPPRSDGSYYFNYKGDHSIVLLAVVDAKYRFIYTNVGCNGRVSDGGVYRESYLKTALEGGDLNLPSPEPLPDRTMEVPYVIVADEAFPLSTHILKAFPSRGLTHDERIFNYRLCRARRVVENAFGILANRFRVLLNPIALRAEKIRLACVALHNFLLENNSSYVTDARSNSDMNCLTQLQAGNRSGVQLRNVRNEFKDFFISNGRVNFQEENIKKFNL